jgi:minor extracellular serine protease Vpr
VRFAQRGRPVTSITVPARGDARVDVDIAPAAGLEEGALYGGWLVFTPDGGDAPLRVPYAGYKGDYQAVAAMTPTTRGFPWLARQTAVTPVELGGIHPLFAKQDAGAAFTLAPVTFGSRTGADIPVVLVHLNNFARRVVLEVRRPAGRRALGEAFAQDYVPRNHVENLLAAPWGLTTTLPFDGTVRAGHRRLVLPDGEYQLVVTVQRALASRATPLETWTSPVFRIDRPD